jgi:hypothetical protein
MLRVLVLYSVIYVDILSNSQQLKNKRYNLLFIAKYENPNKLVKYQSGP